MAYTPITLPSYFIADINIPNVDVEPGLSEINLLIVRFEKECLRKLLGPVLWNLYQTEVSSRMTAIKNGVTYNVSGTTYVWRGLAQTEELVALPAYYVYCKYKDIHSKITVGTGTKTSDHQGGRATSPAFQIKEAWNLFSEWSLELIAFLVNYLDNSGARVYPEFESSDYYSARFFSEKRNELDI